MRSTRIKYISESLVREERMLLITLGLFETCYIFEGESAYIMKWHQWVQYYSQKEYW